jgi:O-antigen ligase
LSVLVALMPACFAVSMHIKTLPMAALVIIGCVLLIRRPDTRAGYAIAWPVAAVFALRLLYDIGNFLGHRLGWATLDLPLQTVLFLAIAAAFSVPLKTRVVAIGFSLTAILLGITCLVQRYVQGYDRPFGLNGGDWASIEFAMYLLVLVVLAILQALRPSTPRLDRTFHVVAAIIGLYGAVLTQSRGPLIAFGPIFLGLMLWYAARSRQWRRALGVCAITIALMAGVTATLHREMIDRLSDVSTELATYDQSKAVGAVHERIEMWEVSMRAFRAHPLAGIGLDQFGSFVQAQAAVGKANPAISKYVHPHNEYLESMVAGGVPALMVLLLFLGIPLAFFARRVNDPREPVATCAMAGTMVIVMYGLCAFSDNVFYRAMPQSLYLFLVLGLAVSIGRQIRVASPS